MKILVLVASLALVSGLKAQDLDTAKTMEVPAILITNVNESLSAERRHIDSGRITINRPNGNFRSLVARITLTCESGERREASLILLDRSIVPENEQARLRGEDSKPLSIEAAVYDLIGSSVDASGLSGRALKKAEAACEEIPALYALSLWTGGRQSQTKIVWTPMTPTKLAELTK